MQKRLPWLLLLLLPLVIVITTSFFSSVCREIYIESLGSTWTHTGWAIFGIWGAAVAIREYCAKAGGKRIWYFIGSYLKSPKFYRPVIGAYLLFLVISVISVPRKLEGLSVAIQKEQEISVGKAKEIDRLKNNPVNVSVTTKNADEDARKQISAATNEMVKLTRENEALRTDNERLGDRISAIEQPRSISPQQQSNLIECLKEGEGGTVAIGHQTLGTATKEAREYLQQMLPALNGARKFRPSATTNHLNWAMADEPGVLLYVRDELKPPLHALSIQKCFLTNGIGPVRIRTDRDLSIYPESDIVVIWVGQRY